MQDVAIYNYYQQIIVSFKSGTGKEMEKYFMGFSKEILDSHNFV